MGDENSIYTLGDYSKPSHEGYKNTIEVPVGNNVVPLRSDTVRLVQNGCLFHRLWSEDPNQHLKDFLKLVDSLDLDGENRERTRLTAKLRNDILIFQQHQGESLFKAWTHFKDLLQKVPHHGIDLWLQIQIFYDHVNPITRRTINQSAGGKLRDLNAKESWALLEDLALYDNESWNDPRDFAKPVKVIALPQDVPNPQCSSHLSTSINAIKARFNETIISQTSLQQPVVEIKPQQPEEPRPTLENKFKDLHLNIPVLEVLAHAPIYNAILDKYVESLELGKNGSAFVQGEIPTKMGDPGIIQKHNPILPLQEETDHIFGLANGTKSYPVRIVKDVEVHIGKLKLFNDFYVLDMKKDPETPLLVGRGFLATADAVIDCRMAKIAIGKGITRLVFGVKGVDLCEEEAPYWTILEKRESNKPRPSSDGIGAKSPYYARKDFLDCHLPGEWEISRDVELNPFKDTLVFRRMVEFLGAIPINLKCNMWESEDLIKKPINWDRSPKLRRCMAKRGLE
ncbi:MAK10-like protein [Tanacetum coccineum]